MNQGAVRGEFIEPLACMGTMEFFLDTADVDEIREIAAWGILDGVTTNPSLIKKSGRDFKEVVREIAVCTGRRRYRIRITRAQACIRA